METQLSHLTSTKRMLRGSCSAVQISRRSASAWKKGGLGGGEGDWWSRRGVEAGCWVAGQGT
jgi:hypothetical protein